MREVVAIDGPAGSGKSTVARLLAKEIGGQYVDSGAFYRSLTLAAMNSNINLEDASEVTNVAKNSKINLEINDNNMRVLLNGDDVSTAIRTPEVTNNAHYIARVPDVRKLVVDMLREYSVSRRIVMEGRDITTVVFPDAAIKFYLDASPEERAGRRYKEMQEKGLEGDYETVLSDIKIRDERDFTRKDGPLTKAEDAEHVETSSLSLEEVVNVLREKCQEKFPNWTV